MMKGLVHYHARPRLNSPAMLAVWPGIGNVAVIVANYLRKQLEFKRLAEIEPSRFFNPIGVVVKENIVEEPQFPQSRFYYWKNKKGARDLILFMGDDQPVTQNYELANVVLEVGLKFQIKRVYTLAAALTHVHHTERPRVWGVGTTKPLTKELRQLDLIQGGNLQIAGLNGLLLGVAKERELEGICLLGEVPMYATRVQNPMAALSVLEALTMMLEIKIDMSEMEQLAAETQEKMKQMVAEAMGEYISYFTEPIWEQGQDPEEDDEEE
ncbi:MAG: PAC2 family protein [Dehalococcoidales bacterium]|nr:PAC2 family protein [Dehalococcoidales bacterium]